YVGVMAEQDGVDGLLRAANRIVQVLGRRDIRFMLIGGGPSLPALQTLASELGISEFVDFVGYKTGDDLLRHLSSCEVCVSPDPPSEYNQMCTMNKVMEYMALGKPIVQYEMREGRASAGEASVYAASE